MAADRDADVLGHLVVDLPDQAPTSLAGNSGPRPAREEVLTARLPPIGTAHVPACPVCQRARCAELAWHRYSLTKPSV
jgi:hypothetical protein